VPNLIATPGFEEEGWWEYVTQAERRSDLGAYAGSWAAYISGTYRPLPPPPPESPPPPFPPPNPPVLRPGILRTPEMAVTPGLREPIRFRANPALAGERLLRVSADPGDGIFVEKASITPTGTAWDFYALPPVLMVGTSARLMFEGVPTLLPTGPGGGWLLDDVVFGVETYTVDEMINLIRSAIVTRFAAINTPSYLTDPKVVKAVKIGYSQIEAFPAILVFHDSGESGPATGASLKKARRRARFGVDVFAKDEAGGPDQIEMLLRDMTKALETDQAWNLVGADGAVEPPVTLSSWEVLALDPAVYPDVSAATAIIEVGYITPYGTL
jgi:hypothetical protein